MYKTARWRTLRDYQLSIEPLCRFCLITEDVTAAEVDDHIKTHKGDVGLFYDLRTSSRCASITMTARSR